MKKFISCLFIFVFYVVVNKDASIHTIAIQPNDVLIKGQKRYIIDEIPENYKNEDYYWGSSGLTIKDASEVLENTTKNNETIRKIKLRNLLEEKSMIEYAKTIDGGDWSEEENSVQKKIDKIKKKKEVVLGK